MLQTLRINEFLLFQNQEIELSGKFTAITGETGSGKSMFIKALRFVLGEKQDLPVANYSVTAEFKIGKDKNNLLEIFRNNEIEIEDNLIILRRILNDEGKSRSFINDVAVSPKLLKVIGEELIEFHSQHKQLDAFSDKKSLDLLDIFLNEKELLESIEILYAQIKYLDKEIDNAIKEISFLKFEHDHIQHSFNELKSLAVQPNEEEELIEKKRAFNDKAKIITYLKDILSIFEKDGSITNSLIRNQRNISKYEDLSSIDQQLELSINTLSDLELMTNNFLKDLSYFDNIEEIEDRLSRLKEFSRKYRCNSNQLIELCSDFQNKIEKLENLDLFIHKKTKEKNILLEKYFLLAQDLSKKRKIIAKQLEEVILSELKLLKLEQVELSIDIRFDKLRPISPKGMDSSRFLIRTNKSFDFASINEIASGGELSRIMLAFKVALARNSAKTTIIFDEIDSGTGGAVAEVIGKRLKNLAENNQVITISHQPQVASKADQHLLITKIESRTDIINLDEDGTVREVARMLAGENITESAIKAAICLINP